MIEFIIPTYNRTEQLQSMLASLVAQIDDDWIATVVVDDEDNEDNNNRIKRIIDNFNTNKIKYIFTGKRFNDYGHEPREVGKQLSKADYIVMTGDDNYYVPSFVKEINYVVKNDNVGMVYCDMIHNGYDYVPFYCRIIDGYIDMGAFVTRRDLAQQLKLGKEYCADGYYTINFCKLFPNEKTVKINKILFVHN